MTKIKTIQYIKKEIEKLNKKIDLLILSGKCYKKEASIHFKLVQSLKKLA